MEQFVTWPILPMGLLNFTITSQPLLYDWIEFIKKKSVVCLAKRIFSVISEFLLFNINLKKCMLPSLDEIRWEGSGEEGFQSLLFFLAIVWMKLDRRAPEKRGFNRCLFAITISPWQELWLVEVVWLKIGKIVLENGKKMSLKTIKVSF